MVLEQYNVTGMSCAACSAKVEKAVTSVEGVTSCSVNLLTHSMTVEGGPPDRVIAAVTKAGYGATLKGEKSSKPNTQENSEVKPIVLRLVFSSVFLLLLMYVSMGHGMLGAPLPHIMEQSPLAIGCTQLLLSAIVLVINQTFFIRGVRGVLHGAPNMDTLVALGSGASFLYSTAVLYQMIFHPTQAAHYLHDLYFESAAMILTLITVGKLLETVSKGKTTSALRRLMTLAPQTASVIRNGKEEQIPIEQLAVGDRFVVRPGERIPVDGVIVDGAGAVDESALTGESIPVDKVLGNPVFAATMNQSGFLTCQATKVGQDTTLSRIIQLVSDAAATKAPIGKIADKVSGVFVPAVIGIALVTLMVWLLLGQSFGFSLARAVSVLVISCPCALGLATPVAIMVGSGVGAKHGLLFKTAAVLEQTGKIKVVALDKTGTITKGKPFVTDVIPADGISKMDLLLIALSLEEKSEHPLANAVINYGLTMELTPLEVTEFSAVAGGGLTAKRGKDVLFGGNLAFVGGYCQSTEWAKTQSEQLADQGKTPLIFGENQRILGIIAVADEIKEDSAFAIAALKNMGIKTVMLTGDNPKTANAIAAQAGVDEVLAGVLPQDKEATIRTLQGEGITAMVGDGINAAPALTRADVGIAIGAGTDIALDAADMVLMNSTLMDVPAAIRLSRAVLKTIKQNLFWAFAYNLIGIPLAAGAFIAVLGWEINPMFGAAAMSLSSFCVVTNALRLNFVHPHNAKRDRKIKQKKGKSLTMTKTMTIQGMMCPHCSGRVKTVLESIDGVAQAQVDHITDSAVVTLTGSVSDDLLKETVEKEGYTVTAIQ